MSHFNEEKLWVIVGPTASGKSRLALELAEAIGGEILNADSVQVYRYFDIGSAKPGPEDLMRVPHHLIDICEPDQGLDAARWAELAELKIAEIRERGHIPILCGGSFLFVRALLYGFAKAPSASPEIRARHQALVSEQGAAGLYAQLCQVDSARAAELNPNDVMRVSRALEIFELSGVPMSVWQAEHGFREVRHPARLLGVQRAKPELDELIAARLNKMFELGWLEEVEQLLARGYGGARAMSAVGYRQLAEALAESSALELRSSPRFQEVQGAIYRATRVYARRQRTWLRDEPVEWLQPGALPSLSPA